MAQQDARYCAPDAQKARCRLAIALFRAVIDVRDAMLAEPLVLLSEQIMQQCLWMGRTAVAA
jgi:hypothetical protein